jgi:hypothetical protein
MTSYRSRLPVGSGMGLSTSAMSLRTKPVNLTRSVLYFGHVLTVLPSLALPGDEFASEDFATLIISILGEKESTSIPSVQGAARQQIERRDSDALRMRSTHRTFETRVEPARNIRTAHALYSKESFVPRRLRFVEDLVNCWRDGSSSRGCIFALRRLQKATDRKRLIPAYKNAWWVSMRHKDCLARYKVVMKQVVMMNIEMINLDDRGEDADWEEAILRFRAKWDDPPDHVGLPNNLSRYLAKFRSDGTAAHIFAT